ncbi:hypothetical protein AB4125_20525 [Vibrio splendidus]
MTNEELQLYNDLVKVGFPVLGTLFGGAIGALSTYFITKLNHNNDNNKENIKKRHELVMKAAHDITEFEHLFAIYSAALANYLRNPSDDKAVKEAKGNAFNSNHTLRRARMTLKVLGLHESEKFLEEYIELTREVLGYGVNLTLERAGDLSVKISKGPVEFYKSLSSELVMSK